jgi:hypothetical protein
LLRNFPLVSAFNSQGRLLLGVLETMPRAWVAVRIAPDAFAAPLALALGFSLVGVVLVVAIPLVALALLLSQQAKQAISRLIVSGHGFVNRSTLAVWRKRSCRA